MDEGPSVWNEAAEEQSRTLVAALAEVGRYLFVGGSIMGPDRVDGRSRWDYGDDRVVGLAVVVEVGAELGLGTIALLDQGRLYGAAALLRQLVEIEYLCWAFAGNAETARQWLTADRGTLLKAFAPAVMRKASNGLFAAGEYQSHCELGGHPSPASRSLLPNHSMAVPAALLWTDLANHLIRLWRHLRVALDVMNLFAYMPDQLLLAVTDVLDGKE